MGVLQYAKETYPDLRLHLSVQGSASNAESLNFYREHFDIKRAVLPRVLDMNEIKALKEELGDFELEVFGFGGLCINICGRCYLSSYITGVSCNTGGVCSPSSHVTFENDGDELKVSLGNVVLNKYAPNEVTSYPTSCKGRYYYNGEELGYPIEEPSSLNILEILPQMIETGVDSLKLEGRQRTRSYVGTVTGILREAIDRYYDDPEGYHVDEAWMEQTAKSMEGMKTTYGSYVRK
jgi:putative protease